MRVRIDLPELKAEYEAHVSVHKSDPFRPWQSAPRPEWHGKEVEQIGPGVVVFPGDPLTQYQIINPKHLIAL